MGRIFYFCPDFTPPSAGTRRLYRHVSHLNRLGYRAAIVHQKRGFVLKWHGHEVPVIWIEDQPVFEKEDILVFPEGMTSFMKHTRNFPCIRIAIVLNWAYVFPNLPQGENWLDYGISHVITPSTVIKEFIEWSMGIDVSLVSNYLDTSKFSVHSARKEPKIAYMSRKDPSGDILRAIFEKRGGSFEEFRWALLHNLTEDQYADELKTSTFFLATSSQEGLPTSILEAMAAGCIVIGFSGVGGNDHMVGSGDRQNCILIENGNLPALGRKLEEVLLTWKGNPHAYNQVKTKGMETAAKFHDSEAEAQSLDAFFAGLSRL